MYDQIAKNSGTTQTFNPTVVGLTNAPECEIRIMLNQQSNAVETMEKTMMNLFSRLAPILSQATPKNESADKQSTTTSMGAELANTNQKLWNIQDGLNDLMNRIQL